jgi:hypothetical protein
VCFYTWAPGSRLESILVGARKRAGYGPAPMEETDPSACSFPGLVVRATEAAEVTVYVLNSTPDKRKGPGSTPTPMPSGETTRTTNTRRR